MIGHGNEGGSSRAHGRLKSGTARSQKPLINIGARPLRPCLACSDKSSPRQFLTWKTEASNARCTPTRSEITDHDMAANNRSVDAARASGEKRVDRYLSNDGLGVVPGQLMQRWTSEWLVRSPEMDAMICCTNPDQGAQNSPSVQTWSIQRQAGYRALLLLYHFSRLCACYQWSRSVHRKGK